MFVEKKTNSKKRHPSDGVLRVLPSKKNTKTETEKNPPIIDWREHFPEQKETDQQAASRETSLFHPNRGFKKGDLLFWLKKLWLPILAAVIVGLAIGFTLMILISKDNTVKKPLTASTTQTTGTTVKTLESRALPADLQIKFYGVQANVFSNQVGAADFQKQLLQKGIASLILPEKNYPVIIGLASNESTGKTLAAAFKSQGIAVYVKSFSLPVSNKSKFNDAEIKVLQNSKSLISQVINAGIGTGNFNPENLNTQNLQAIQNQATAIGGNKNFSSSVQKKVSAVYDSTISLLAALRQTDSSGTAAKFMTALKAYFQIIE